MHDDRLTGSPVLDLDVGGSGAATIQGLARQLAGTSPTDDPMSFVSQSESLVSSNPVFGPLREILRGRPSAVRIRGLRASTAEPTPAAPLTSFDSIQVPAATLGLIASTVGRHRGFERESNGRLIHSVAPFRKNRDLQISSSSSVELELHTELAYAAHMPDFVLLLCARRGPGSVATLVAPVGDILADLPEEVVQTLREPRFMTSVDIVVRGRVEAMAGPISVLEGAPDEEPKTRCDFGEVEPTDEASDRALSALRLAAKRRMACTVLDVGDLLIIDNRRAMHGRLPFEANFDGHDRWLLRSYVWGARNAAVELASAPIVTGALVS